MAFCDEDEDTVSMALTALHGLLETHSIDPRQIGRWAPPSAWHWLCQLLTAQIVESRFCECVAPVNAWAARASTDTCTSMGVISCGINARQYKFQCNTALVQREH